ncbi:MAG: hypothetical protein HY235_20915 [Acidobacteria bacterium]|nr:hypothetical protein [Acidobacteriota bacterium]
MTALALAGGRLCADPTPHLFPMMGGSLGNVIQLNVGGLGGPDTRCQAQLGFRDLRNMPVGPSRAVDLGPGETASLTLNFNTLVSMSRQRFELRPLVTPANRDGSNFACKSSAEIYEPGSGRDLAWASPAILDPGIAPVLPPVSAALYQTLRLGAIGDPDLTPAIGDPNVKCAADLVLRNSRGVVVARKTVSLGAGMGDFVDLNMNTQVSRLGERAIIDPGIIPAPGTSAAGCRVSVQLIDQFTGWTTLIAATH